MKAALQITPPTGEIGGVPPRSVRADPAHAARGVHACRGAYLPLAHVVAEEPLLQAARGVPEPGGAVFLGTGLTTRHELGEGLSFDALILVLMAERIRAACGLDRIIHLIADVHAESNAFVEPRAVRRLAQDAILELRAACRALNIDRYEVLTGSEVLTDERYPEILQQVREHGLHRYERLEVADIEWARRFHGATVKVGWAMSKDLTDVAGFDERRFDAAHTRVFGDRLAFAYTVPGRSDDPQRPRVGPYVRLGRDARPGLLPGEALELRSNGLQRHLGLVLDAVEARLGAPAKDLPLADRVQRVQETIQAHIGCEETSRVA